jgi:2-polyprenyl-6-methoxyphenol hydroxylase-like FAD-dependent oxidoreductase
MVIKNKTIAIIGGGPGGLTLARLLQMNGADVKVYERDINKDVRVQGATLDLHYESGLRALQQAGLMDAFKENYRPGADLVRIADKHANIVIDEHENDARSRVFGTETFRPEIDRGPLRKILLESLAPGSVVWDSRFESLDPNGDGWKINFNNHAHAFADMVIAADGANSKVRPYITPLKPFYCGVTAIEAYVYNSETAIPGMHNLLKGGKIFAIGDDGRSLIVSSKGDDSLAFYAGFKADENWVQESGIDFKDKHQVIEWFKKEYTGWDKTWLELFENAGGFIPRQILSMPLSQTWEALPNITMLGDAAHLMPPYAGEGVNMAMLDALELSECLLSDNFTAVQSAIEAYEKQMLVRASEATEMSIESTHILHSPQGMEFLKNIIS